MTHWTVWCCLDDLLVLTHMYIGRAAAILTFMAGRKPPGKPSLLRNLITAYMVITAMVEVSIAHCTLSIVVVAASAAACRSCMLSCQRPTQWSADAVHEAEDFLCIEVS